MLKSRMEEVMRRKISRLMSFKFITTCMAVSVAILLGTNAGYAAPGEFGVKIYRINYGLYPYVQVYARTSNENKEPLVNLNAMNIGLMVKGKTYDPQKSQYMIQSLKQRPEAVRSVLILDASKSMAGAGFESARLATGRFIDNKRPQDEVAVLAIRDTKEGYEIISKFESDPGLLGRRLSDIKVDGDKSRIYDSIAAGMQMCGMTSTVTSFNSQETNLVASCSVVVFSDGHDEGSALSREELNTRITSLKIPIPIYSLAFGEGSEKYFTNLESLSKNSFGIYFKLGIEKLKQDKYGHINERMNHIVEDIQNILQSDYVISFRSYVPVDGEKHSFKIGVEYPSGSKKYYFDEGQFEAIQPPPIKDVREAFMKFEEKFPPATVNPYFDSQSETQQK